MSDSNLNSRDGIISEVTRRAAVDREFRERLLTAPREALASVLGQPLPGHIQIRFIEKDPDLDALIVLPDFVPETEELTEEDLDAVAGGADTDDADCWMTM